MRTPGPGDWAGLPAADQSYPLTLGHIGERIVEPLLCGEGDGGGGVLICCLP